MGTYLKCPKCGSICVEVFEGETKKKFNWSFLIDKHTSSTKYVRELKKHCKDCGYVW